MPSIALHCRHCGRTVECEADRLPPYGARARCAECGSLLPLIGPPGVSEASTLPAAPEELARLHALWEASVPGPESARVFQEELQAALERLRSGGAG